jgi:hypothetical protein
MSVENIHLKALYFNFYTKQIMLLVNNMRLQLYTKDHLTQGIRVIKT